MAKIWTWQEVGDTPDRVLSQAEKQEIADEWTANEIKKEEEQTEEFLSLIHISEPTRPY